MVEDATRDPRFWDNPFVRDEHHLRFYAGAPIFDATGLPLGAVCVCHDSPMTLDSRCQLSLRRAAEIASALFETRLLLAEAHARYVPKVRASLAQARLDALLLTLTDSEH